MKVQQIKSYTVMGDNFEEELDEEEITRFFEKREETVMTINNISKRFNMFKIETAKVMK